MINNHRSPWRSFENSLTHHIQPIASNGAEVIEVNLYVTSKKYQLKKINLGELREETIADKVEKWNHGNRFVIVIKVIDGNVFAHAHREIAEQLQEHHDLNIEGIRVTVESLSDEQYARLAIVGDLLSEYCAPGKIKEEQKAEEKELNKPKTISHGVSSQTLPIRDNETLELYLASLQNIPLEVTKLLAERFNERARAERREEENVEKKKKIQHQVIQKEILNQEIEIQVVKRDAIKQDAIEV